MHPRRAYLPVEPDHLAPEERLAVAVCDVYKTRREDSAVAVDKYYNDGSKCATYADFREVLANPEIDAVCIATPDHWHAYISVEAMKHGKDVYCEKQLTYSIDEAKKVIEVQKKNSVGTDPIKGFILKGFGIVREQAPAIDVLGWERRKPHRDWRVGEGEMGQFRWMARKGALHQSIKFDIIFA